MRKLAMAGGLAAALAWTSAAVADDTQEKKAEAQQEARKTEAEARRDVDKAKTEANKDVQKADAEARKDVSKARAEAAEKTQEADKDAAERRNAGTGSTGAERDRMREEQGAPVVGAHEREDTRTGRDARGMDKKHPMFEGKDNFKVEGKIAQASNGSLTVTREEMPPAKLMVDGNTKIELDGQNVSAAQLRPGQEVKASFNLQNDKPMAVEIKAEKAQ